MLGPWIKVNQMWSSRRWVRVYINILGWMGMEELNSDNHYIYFHGQESLRRNGVILLERLNKRVWNAVLGYNLKNNRMISVHFQGKSFNITVIQVYVPTTDAEESEVVSFYENLQDLLELTPKRKKKSYPFHHRGLECKSRKSRDTWRNRQVGHGVQNEAG